jgi:hypothetical protein
MKASPCRRSRVVGWASIAAGASFVLALTYVLSFCLVTAYVSRHEGKLAIHFGDAVYRPLWALTDTRNFCGLLLRDNAELCLDVMMYGPGAILDGAWIFLLLEAVPILAVLYVVSFGPVVAMLSRSTGQLRIGAGSTYYRPLWRLCDGDDLFSIVLLNYAEQCLHLVKK